MAQRMRVHESSSEEGNRLLRFVRRSFGSVVRWGGRKWCCCQPKAWMSRRSRGGKAS